MPAGVIKQADYLAIQSAKSRVEAVFAEVPYPGTDSKWVPFITSGPFLIHTEVASVMLMDVVIQSTNCSP